MARIFRYYEKKRGHRRTGSRTIGSLGEAIFFALLLLVGCAGIVAGIWLLVIPEWRVNHGFVEQTCVVLQKQLVQEAGQNGPVFRPRFRVEYQVQGVTRCPFTYGVHLAYPSSRGEAQEMLDRFSQGQKYPCWYDPAHPDDAVLVRGYQWWNWLLFLIPGSFLMIGAGGLLYSVLHWGRSAERRAAMSRRGPTPELFDAGRAGDPRFPTVPDSSDITASPGTKLAYRLPLSSSPAWALFGLLAACVAWNGAVSYFAVTAVMNHLEGRPDWFLTLFNLPFLAIGVALAALFLRQLLTTAGIGPTLVEISDHPLLPGRSYELFLSQSGRLRMESLELALVCEEEATYRQGTNTRTETREVYRRQMLGRQQFDIRQGEPFEAQCTLSVPAGAMHSFKADHNQIHWKVVVQGEAANWPEFQRAFPLVVYPGQGRPGP